MTLGARRNARAGLVLALLLPLLAPAPAVPASRARLPALVAFPYRVAGTGGDVQTIRFGWDRDEAVHWQIEANGGGEPAFTLESAPARLTRSGDAVVTLRWRGEDTQRIDMATLVADTASGGWRVPLVAVAGDPALPPGSWQDVPGPDGASRGRALTLALPTAPFPDAGAPWKDPSVRIFVPDGYRERGKQDLVVHYHGWNQDILGTLATHHYEDHVWASGTNTILVIPQGPEHARSGKFGKLMRPDGLGAFTRELLVVLYRELDLAPALGDLVLTSHSGGYQAVAAGLEAGSPPVAQVGLFDALYGRTETFAAWALAGGRLRSVWTVDGGTAAPNQEVDAVLRRGGVPTSPTLTTAGYRDAAAVIAPTPSTHDGSTGRDGAYAEQLRWGLRHSRRGPRVDLRSVLPDGEHLLVRWFSPRDDDLRGFDVQRSRDGRSWTTVASVGAAADAAGVASGTGSWRIRVLPRMEGVSEPLPSDVYLLDPNPSLLIVDAMDRFIGGGAAGLSHDVAAEVAGALGGTPGVATVSERAITESEVDLTPYSAVLWLAGSDRPEDVPLPEAARVALRAFVEGGGRLMVSGSAVAEALRQDDPGFLAEVLGARFVGDVLDVAPGGARLDANGLGRPGHAALLTVPVEAMAPPSAQADRLREVLAWVGAD